MASEKRAERPRRATLERLLRILREIGAGPRVLKIAEKAVADATD